MPSRTPFKKSIANIQPLPVPAPVVNFATLPTTDIEDTQAGTQPDGPTLVPDGYASASRGAVFLDLNSNRIVPDKKSASIQLEKDASTFYGVKTSPRRSDLLMVTTPFLDIPDNELNELLESRKLENGIDEADLMLVGKTAGNLASSLKESRSKVDKINKGLTDLVVSSEKPLASLDIVRGSKEIISSVQESVIELDLPCEQPNYDIEDLCGISDRANVQSSTRILSLALAVTANDGDPGSEFVVKQSLSPMTKLAGKSIKFVSKMGTTTVGKKTSSKSAENPTNARDQSSIIKVSAKTQASAVGRKSISTSSSNDERFEVPITAVADRWDDIDEIVKYSERTVDAFSNYDKFDIARQGKPVASTLKSIRASIQSSVSSSRNQVSRQGTSQIQVSRTGSTSGTAGLSAIASGKSGKTTQRASTVGTSKSASGKSTKDSSTKSSASGSSKTTVAGKSSSKSSVKSSSVKSSSVVSSITEKSSTRTATIISRLCATISNILRREMMLTRATNVGIAQSASQDRVTSLSRSLIRTRSSVSSLSIMNLGSTCTGTIVSTHFDTKRSSFLLEPKLVSNKKTTLTGAFENLILPAVRYPGNSTGVTTYVQNLKNTVISPIDQLQNIMLVDIANDITPTVIFRTAISEISSALSSLEEILEVDGGGLANEQVMELICMNLYADPNFKRRSKKLIYQKFLNPDKQFSFTGGTETGVTVTNPDSKTKVKTRVTADGETTESVAEVQVENEPIDEEDDPQSSPESFASDVKSVRTRVTPKYSDYDEDVASARAGTLTFQTKASEILDSFGKTGESSTLCQAVINVVESLIDVCKNSMGASVLSEDESSLKQTGFSIDAMNFLVFDLVSEICRSMFFMNIFKDTALGQSDDDYDPSFTVSLKSSKNDKGDYLSPEETVSKDILDSISESTGALLGLKEITSGSKSLKAIASEIQEYENDIRDHYARLFALNEIFDSVYQSFDEFRELITSGDVAYARQVLGNNPATRNTVSLLSNQILADCKWRSSLRSRSIFDGTYRSMIDEIDCVRRLFSARNTVVTNDVIGDSKNSILCAVGIPYGMSAVSQDSLFAATKLVEVEVSKRDIEFQGLIFESLRFKFDPLLRVIVSSTTTSLSQNVRTVPKSKGRAVSGSSETLQSIIERGTQYYIFRNGSWVLTKYQDVIKRYTSELNLKPTDAQQIVRNHVIDYMSKCFLRHVTHMEFSHENIFKSQKKVTSAGAGALVSISNRLRISPQGVSLADILRVSSGGYSVSPGPHAIDGSNEADLRLLYRILQDPAMSGDFILDEIFGTTPYESIYCIVVDPDTFEVQTDSSVPLASYSAVLESLGEVTSLKTPGDNVVISTKTGKYLRQRNVIRRFSGSEISVEASLVEPIKSVERKQTSKSNTKESRFGYRPIGRIS